MQSASNKNPDNSPLSDIDYIKKTNYHFEQNLNNEFWWMKLKNCQCWEILIWLIREMLNWPALIDSDNQYLDIDNDLMVCL